MTKHTRQTHKIRKIIEVFAKLLAILAKTSIKTNQWPKQISLE